MRLGPTMETMHAAGRRHLPPVPRLGKEQAAAVLRSTRGPLAAAVPSAGVDAATERFVLGPPTGEQPAARQVARAGVRQHRPTEPDAAQEFVARLRGAAADFAEAAGASSAVVREAVPPARHRRARCRLMLRYADGSEADTTFLGPAGSPTGTPARHGFDRQIRRWLAAGQPREGAWLAADPDASGGIAVDLTAWAPAR